VLEAVEKGEFRVYGAEHVDEAAELLMDVPAGKALKKGGFTPGSIYARVLERIEKLRELHLEEARKRAQFGVPPVKPASAPATTRRSSRPRPT
ncbi:MAG: ATP-dependent protease, partial [Pseudomonadota bacterium]